MSLLCRGTRARLTARVWHADLECTRHPRLRPPATAAGKYTAASSELRVMPGASSVESGLLTNCTCNKGYTGPDGTECVLCLAGTYPGVVHQLSRAHVFWCRQHSAVELYVQQRLHRLQQNRVRCVRCWELQGHKRLSLWCGCVTLVKCHGPQAATHKHAT